MTEIPEQPHCLCPKCERPMASREESSIEFDMCSECGGLWFDSGELKAYAGRHAGVQNPDSIRLGLPSTGRPLADTRCCRCHGPTMQAIRYQDVEIERCAECLGVFLDAGEVSRFTRSMESQMPSQAPTRDDGNGCALGAETGVSLADVVMAILDAITPPMLFL